MLEAPSYQKAPMPHTIVTSFALLATCFHAGLLLVLFFNPEDRAEISLRKVG